MVRKVSWMGIGVCAVVSFAGTSSYGGSIDFGNCSQISITTPAFCPNTDAGTSKITYTNGGLSVTAWGFLNAGGNENLYVKSSGPGETGLGTIIDTADHEITADDFVNFDFSNLLANHITSAQITIESLQQNEFYTICQGGTVGLIGISKTCKSGTEVGNTLDHTISISWTSSADDIFGIQGYGVGGGDVLVQGITFTTPSPTPEPASLLLFGTGIASFLLKGKRRSAKLRTATV